MNEWCMTKKVEWCHLFECLLRTMTHRSELHQGTGEPGTVLTDVRQVGCLSLAYRAK